MVLVMETNHNNTGDKMTTTTLETLTMSNDSGTPAWDLRDLAIQRVDELKSDGVDAFWVWRGMDTIEIMVED